MSVPVGVRASLLAVAGLIAIAVTPVAAKPTVSVSIQEDVACHFIAIYDWSGIGHGSDLSAHIGFVAVDGGGEAVLEWSTTSPVSGRFGESSQFFTSTESASYQYKVVAYLQTSSGSVIAKTETQSSLAPGSPETCS
jgi:hypothetical protein